MHCNICKISQIKTFYLCVSDIVEEHLMMIICNRNMEHLKISLKMLLDEII
jgi:hypothetical protein